MGTVIGLDVGDVRVGIALGTTSPITCRPYQTLLRKTGKAEQGILKIIQDRKVELVVVGLPLNDDNTKNEQCSKIEKFCTRLQKRTDVKFEFIDEFASTSEARELMANKKGRSADVDSLAACLILKRYLDGQSRG